MKLAKEVHFGLQTTDDKDNQRVEEGLEPGDIAEKRRKAGHLTTFLLHFLAQIEPVSQGTARLVRNRQDFFRETVDIEQCNLFWL